MTELESGRNHLLIDPSLHVWGWQIALYLFLGGIVAGIMVFTGLRFLGRTPRPPSLAMALIPWFAPLLLSLGMLFLWLDLEHPFNAWRFYMVFQVSSPMSWGAWILLAVYPSSVALAWVSTREALGGPLGPRDGPWSSLWLWLTRRLAGVEGWLRAHLRGLALSNLLLGSALGIYTGILLGTMAARPLWNSPLLGPLFLVSGMSSAAAFMLLYPLSERERVFLGRTDLTLILVEMGLLFLWMVGLASAGAASQSALALVTGGPFTASFWSFVVAVGLVVPLVAEWVELRHGQVPGRSAAVLVLIGGFALRWILVYAGQASGWSSEMALM